MGRECGYLALMTGIAGGAEEIIIPEVAVDPEEVVDHIHKAYEKGKAHAIIVVAEGAKYNATKLAAYFEEHHERIGFDLRVTILGHIQRGGYPSAFDRILASRLGTGAVDQLDSGEAGMLMGLLHGEVTPTPLEEVVNNRKKIDLRLFEMATILD
jgi:6-phosphofructokinase 1